jgi:endogenous inhibitor of DNA gyrase (YacG/DUF329 family)
MIIKKIRQKILYIIYKNKKCIICGKRFGNLPYSEKRIYCSEKCNDKNYYKNHKDKIKERVRIWENKNPEKAKENHKKSFNKFIKNKRSQFNKLLMEGYYRNRKKHHSRHLTKSIIRRKKNRVIINKYCKKCNSIEDLQIHHEIYPNTIEEIKNAIDNGKIYYVCSEHHHDLHKKIIKPTQEKK